MAEQHPIPSFPAAAEQPSRDELDTTAHALRSEFDAHEDRSLKASTSHQLARLHALRGDLGAAARDELQATNLAAGFVEPLESLLAIALASRSASNQQKLLERLLKITRTPAEHERVALELALRLIEDNAFSDAASVLTSGLAAAPEASSLWLASELLAAAEGDAAGRLQALTGRAENATGEQLSALLFERLSRLHEAAGNLDDAVAAMLRATDLCPRAESLWQLELLALRANDPSAAADAALVAADSFTSAATDKAGARSSARVRAALHLSRADQPERAIELLQQVSEAPSQVALALLLGLQRRGGDLDGSLRTLDQALNHVAPESRLAVHLQAASLAALVGDDSLFSKHVEASRKISPDGTAPIGLALANTLQGKTRGDAAEALEATASQLADEEQRAQLLVTAAFLWLAEGSAERATACVHLAEKSGFDSQLTSALLAGVLSSSSDFSERIEAILMLLGTQDPKSGPDSESRANTGDATGPSTAGGLHQNDGPGEDSSLQTNLGWQLARLAHLAGSSSALTQAAATIGQDTIAGAFLTALSDPSLELNATALDGVASLKRARRLLAITQEPEESRFDASKTLLDDHPTDPIALAAHSAAALDASPLRGNRATSELLLRLADAIDDRPLARRIRVRAAFDLLSPTATPSDLELGTRLLRTEANETSLAELLPWMARLPGVDASADATEESVDENTRQLDTALHLLQDDLEGALLSLAQPDSAAAKLLGVLLASAIGPDALEDAFITLGDTNVEDTGSHSVDGLAQIDPMTQGGLLLSASDGPSEQLKSAQRWVEQSESVKSRLALAVCARATPDPDDSLAASSMAELSGLLAQEYPDWAPTLGTTARLKSESRLDDPNALQREIENSAAYDRETRARLAWSLAATWTPTSDPTLRATALCHLADQLDEDDPDRTASQLQAAYLSLLAGDDEQALALLEPLAQLLPEDTTVWWGLKRVAKNLDRADLEAQACAELARQCEDDNEAAQLWERAGVLYEDRVGDQNAAEVAFSAALGRVPGGAVAFSRLYRMAHAIGDRSRLVELIDARLDGVESETSRAELLWEKARYCRMLGRRSAALRALDELLELRPNHIPSLALAAELHLVDQRIEAAAEALRTLALHPDVPAEERGRAGLHASDLLERLHRPREAVALLGELESLGLPRMATLERRARTAARSGEWDTAFETFLELAEQRDDIEGRLEAARMTLAIQRDHLRDPELLKDSARMVLRDAPRDRDALDVVLSSNYGKDERKRLLAGGREQCLEALAKSPLDPVEIRRLVAMTEDTDSPALERVTLGALELTGRLSDERRARHSGLLTASAFAPTTPLQAADLETIAAPGQLGAFARFAQIAGPAISAATSPSLEAFGVTPLMRIDPFAQSIHRSETSRWTALVGVSDHELYVGGSEPEALIVLQHDLPTVILGQAISCPLETASRARLAYLTYSLATSTTALVSLPLDEAEEWLLAASRLGAPGASDDVDREVERKSTELSRALSASQREQLGSIAADIEAAGHDVRSLALNSRSSAARMATLAAGSPAILRQLRELVPDDEAKRLTFLSDVVRFALSPEFLTLRQNVGLDL